MVCVLSAWQTVLSALISTKTGAAAGDPSSRSSTITPSEPASRKADSSAPLASASPSAQCWPSRPPIVAASGALHQTGRAKRKLNVNNRVVGDDFNELPTRKHQPKPAAVLTIDAGGNHLTSRLKGPLNAPLQFRRFANKERSVLRSPRHSYSREGEERKAFRTRQEHKIESSTSLQALRSTTPRNPQPHLTGLTARHVAKGDAAVFGGVDQKHEAVGQFLWLAPNHAGLALRVGHRPTDVTEQRLVCSQAHEWPKTFAKNRNKKCGKDVSATISHPDEITKVRSPSHTERTHTRPTTPHPLFVLP